ncbi:MAG: sigma-70 family RNA polymerase sigma factor [Armatimonadota bacterium]
MTNYDWDDSARKIQKAFLNGHVPEAEGDFRILIRTISGELHRIAKAKVPNGEDAEDIVAQAYIDLFRCLKKKEPIGNVKAMLRYFIACRVTDFWRERSGTGENAARAEDGRLRAREVTQDANFWETRGTPATHASKTDTISEIESSIYFGQVRARMRPEHWHILELRHVYGFDTKETADILGITTSMATKRLQAAVDAAQKIVTSFESESETEARV